MPIYEVTATVVVQQTILVEAETKEEARAMATREVTAGESSLPEYWDSRDLPRMEVCSSAGVYPDDAVLTSKGWEQFREMTCQ